jgi:hypothetical protein
VCEKEDQVDQIMLAFPNRKRHCDERDREYSWNEKEIKTQLDVG